MNPGASQTLAIPSFLLDMYHAFLSSLFILHLIQSLNQVNGHLAHADGPSTCEGVRHALGLQPEAAFLAVGWVASGSRFFGFSTLFLPHFSLSQVERPATVCGGGMAVVHPLVASWRVVPCFTCYWVAAVPAVFVSFLVVIVLRVVAFAQGNDVVGGGFTSVGDSGDVVELGVLSKFVAAGMGTEDLVEGHRIPEVSGGEAKVFQFVFDADVSC